MATYTDWQQRQLDSDPAHDKRPAATPRGSFDDWMREGQDARADAVVADLIDDGWSEADARVQVQQMIEDGEL